jgi:DNA-binding MarR family transcriptional regulator
VSDLSKDALRELVWKQDIPPVDKTILLYLAHIADQNGAGAVSLNELGLMCRIETRRATDGLKSLERDGLIRRSDVRSPVMGFQILLGGHDK